MKHTPVLLQEVLEYLDVRPGKKPQKQSASRTLRGKYIDATVGQGGHAKAIMDAGGIVLGIDRDLSAIESLRVAEAFRLPIQDGKLKLSATTFADLREVAQAHGFAEVSGILFDLGMGSHQLDEPDRGFTFQKDGPLDMRFDQTSKTKTASDFVNGYPEDDLRKIFKDYGEERRFAGRIARVIAEERKIIAIETTRQLFELIKRALPAKVRYKANNVARRIFQSLRIAVNDELREIEKALPQTVDLLVPGGRLVVISFHSLEDRIVKKFLSHEAKDCICPPEIPVCRCEKKASLKVLTPKPIIPSPSEVKTNRRSKSAKMRVAEKI